MVMVEFFAALVIAGGSAYAYWHFQKARLSRSRPSCDLRRSLIIVGNNHNDPDCVAQRRALKPALIQVRQAQINVIEVYGTLVPRRNGQPLQWLPNDALRRSLGARSGFHLICIDDLDEVVLHMQRPVSQGILSELVRGTTRLALPAPEPRPAQTEPKADPAPAQATAMAAAPNTSWSVGVLR